MMTVCRKSPFIAAAAAAFACGAEPEVAPPSSPEHLFINAEPPGFDFHGATMVALETSRPAQIFYTLDGSSPTDEGVPYTGPIELTSSTLLSFIALSEDGIWSAPGSELYRAMRNDAVPEALPRLLELGSDVLFFTARPGERDPIVKTLAIRSIGTEPVRILRITMGPNEKGFGFYEEGAFTILSSIEPRTLGPGELMELEVSYLPTDTLRSAVIAIESDEQRSDGLRMIEVWGRIIGL